MTVWNSLLLAAAVSAFSIVLLIYAKRHKAGLPVPVWTIRYGAALAFACFAAVSLLHPYLRVMDSQDMGAMILGTPLFWASTMSLPLSVALSFNVVIAWCRLTFPNRWWLYPMLFCSLALLAWGGYSLASRTIWERHDIAERHTHKAYDLFDAGRYAEAIPEYRKAIALRPTSADLYLQLGKALYQLDQDAEAERSLREAIEIERKYDMGYVVCREEAERYLVMIRQFPYAIRHITR